MNRIDVAMKCFVVWGVLLSPMIYAADNPPSAENVGASEYGYLGVFVTPTHPSLSSNLNGLLKSEQGLTVDEIAGNSAALKAGLKVHDILTSYDDQKLFSVEQFSKLVHADRPGRKVDLEILRNGKLEHLFVVLDKLDPSDFRVWSPTPRSQPYRFGRPDRVPRRFSANPLSAAEWDNFDSLTMKKIGPDELHVELQHVENDGRLHKHVFEGKREEIHQQIDAAKAMKPAERGHLLRALNLYDPGNAAPFPHIWYEPGVGWLFEQPGGPFH